MQDSEFNVKVKAILDSLVEDIEDQDLECKIDIDLIVILVLAMLTN